MRIKIDFFGLILLAILKLCMRGVNGFLIGRCFMLKIICIRDFPEIGYCDIDVRNVQLGF